MPSFSKIFSGIAHTVKSETGRHRERSNSRHATSGNLHGVDEYHTDMCNKVNSRANIKVSLVMESPPIMLYGPPDESSGALFNGSLLLEVFPRETKNSVKVSMKSPATKNSTTQAKASTGKVSSSLAAALSSSSISPLPSTVSVSKLSEDQLRSNYVELRSVEVYFLQVITYDKPFVPSSTTLQQCDECNRAVHELTRWSVLSKRTAFAKGSSHSYPFSYLIPGSLPPTTVLTDHGTSITYELVCKAWFINKEGKLDLINLSLPVVIRRSILRGRDRNSLRVFPPTDVTATAAIPNVAYPRSTFPVEIRMDNVATSDRRWRMRKLTWRVEESVRIKTHHCHRHTAKYKAATAYARQKYANRKLNKNSAGSGTPAFNYFFAAPISRSRVQSRRSNESGENATGATASSVNTNDSDGDNQEANSEDADPTVVHAAPSNSSAPISSVPPALSPFASNWSQDASSSHAFAQIDTEVAQADSNTSRDATSTLEPSEALRVPLHPAASAPSGLSPDKNMRDFYVEQISTLSSGDMKSGWKSDFSDKGRIEFVVEVSVMDLMSMGFNSANTNITTITSENCDSPLFDPSTYLEAGANCSCDIEDPKLGIYVNHNLIVEAVVAEEVVQTSTASKVSPSTKPVTGSSQAETSLTPHSVPLDTSSSRNSRHDGGTGPDSAHGNRGDMANHISGIPTGVARVLRMQFKIVFTERSGLGVSWDDEVPPTYTAVGALSPPTYEEATSNEPKPLLSSLVIPLDIQGLPVTATPTYAPVEPSARLQQPFHISNTVSHLSLDN